MYTGTLPPVSNYQSWSESFQAYDDEDNTLIDISAATEIELQISDCGRPLLTARLSDGTITLGGTTGVFSWSFTLDQMNALCAKTYAIGCVMTLGGETIPLIAGYLPVTNGNIR